MISSISFVFKYIEKKQWFLLGYLSLIFESVTPIVAILLQRDIINNVFIDKQYERFTLLIILYAIFFFGPKLWFTVRRVIFSHISYHLQMSLTHAFLLKIYDIPTASFNKEHTGKLLNHIRNDIADVSDLSVNKLLSEMIKIILSVIFLMCSIAYISFSLLFVVLIITIIYYVLLKKIGEKTKMYSQQVKKDKADVSIAIEESISAVREVVAYNRQGWQLQYYEKRFKSYFESIIKQGLYRIKILLISEPFLYGTKLIVILFGGLNVIAKNISLGEFVVSFTLVDQLVTELGQLFEQALTGKKLVASVECIQSIMNQDDVGFGSLDFVGSIESIKFEDVTFGYSTDSEPVLQNLSMDFPIGKKIAVVGESGSGKSTVAQLLLRSYSADSGMVTINDIPLGSYGDKYTDKISVVYQQPHFLPSTIKENLVLDKEYNQLEVEGICKHMMCHDFIKGFTNQYDTLVGERGASLSGGQKQRLALSRALLKNTDILILDEATSALDVETEFQVQKNIDHLRKGKTTIIIAHRISTIQNADLIYVIDKGSIAAKGTHSELIIESPVYKRLYEIQLKIS